MVDTVRDWCVTHLPDILGGAVVVVALERWGIPFVLNWLASRSKQRAKKRAGELTEAAVREMLEITDIRFLVCQVQINICAIATFFSVLVGFLVARPWLEEIGVENLNGAMIMISVAAFLFNIVFVNRYGNLQRNMRDPEPLWTKRRKRIEKLLRSANVDDPTIQARLEEFDKKRPRPDGSSISMSTN